MPGSEAQLCRALLKTQDRIVLHVQYIFKRYKFIQGPIIRFLCRTKCVQFPATTDLSHFKRRDDS